MTQQQEPLWTDEKIREVAMDDWKFPTHYHATEYRLRQMRAEYEAALAARDEQIAELRRQLAEAQRWMPIEDGFEYKCQCADCLEDTEWQWQLYANRDTIGICDVHGDGDRYIYLPANVRLCRQVDAAQGGGDSEVR